MYKILVIDDEPIVLKPLVAILKYHKYDVDSAQDGKSALLKIKQQDYDIILTDIVLPGMSGTDLLAKIKKINPAIPVIAMTGYGTIENAIEIIKEGAYDFLTKPIDTTKLLSTIDRSMRRYRLSHERILQSKLDDAQNKFLVLTSHEFRTPLGVIRACLDAIGPYLPADPSCQNISSILGETTEHLIDLFENIQVLVSAKEKLIARSTYFEEADCVAENIVEALSLLASQRKQTIIPDIKIETKVYMEQSHFTSIVHELLMNAIRFSQDNKNIWIDIAVTPSRELYLMVKDEGIGIPEDEQLKIFDSFYSSQNPDLHSSPYIGNEFLRSNLGIGLAVCKSLTETYGGKIWVESEPNTGSSFHVLLDVIKPPLEKLDDKNPAKKAGEEICYGTGI